jgi:hypothetical protein
MTGPPRAHAAPRHSPRAPTISLDLSAAFSRLSNATSRRAAASSCPNSASATPSRAARAPGPPSSSAAASSAGTPGLPARYPRIWELSGRTNGPAFPFTQRRTRQRAQKAFRPRPFEPSLLRSNAPGTQNKNNPTQRRRPPTDLSDSRPGVPDGDLRATSGFTNRRPRQRQPRGALRLLLRGCGRPERQRRPGGRVGDEAGCPA